MEQVTLRGCLSCTFLLQDGPRTQFEIYQLASRGIPFGASVREGWDNCVEVAVGVRAGCSQLTQASCGMAKLKLWRTAASTSVSHDMPNIPALP